MVLKPYSRLTATSVGVSTPGSRAISFLAQYSSTSTGVPGVSRNWAPASTAGAAALGGDGRAAAYQAAVTKVLAQHGDLLQRVGAVEGHLKERYAAAHSSIGIVDGFFQRDIA